MKTKNIIAAVIALVAATPLITLKAERDYKAEQVRPPVGVIHETILAGTLIPESSAVTIIKKPEHQSPELSGKRYAELLNEFYEQERLESFEDEPIPKTDKPLRYPLTDEERNLIEHIVMSESGNTEPFEGQELICQCILNACEINDIRPAEAVQMYKYIAGELEPNDSVKAAVSAVFDDGEEVTDEPILFYYNPDLTDCRWHETQDFVMEVGRHKFFKECVDEEKENRAE